METTIFYRDYIGDILGFHVGNGEEKGNYYTISGLYMGYIGVILG